MIISKYNLTKFLLFIIAAFILIVIFFGSFLNLYENRIAIFKKLGIDVNLLDNHHDEKRFLVNPLEKSNRQLPPINIKDLKINNNADVLGQWTAPVDWNVTAIHSVLLPDETVMTFGTFAVDKINDENHNKDIRSNKKITLTDGREMERDAGKHQWEGHDVNSGIDFDIWDPKRGIGPNSHILFKQPVVMDAFCSIVRVLDNNNVFILGGNKNYDTEIPDGSNMSMIYNVQDKKFQLSKNLNFKRWYGSAVITGENKLIVFGGVNRSVNKGYIPSTIPELIDLNNIDQGWLPLEQSKSEDLFGDNDNQREWSYPRTFLASDGNIVGISYNKIWVMDLKNDFRITKTGEIPLVKSGISRIEKFQNPNIESSEIENLKLLTIGSPVGDTNSVVMIDKDQILVFGGKQNGKSYSPSNKVYLIDFSDSFKPKIEELNSMNFARSNANTTILPDGNIFINGGHSYNDLEFSVLTPEIYNPNTQTSKEMDSAYFRRNYHSSSLLLPDGRVLTAGGDVWNAEIFYPPYLFTKDINNRTILADRPEIIDINKSLKRGISERIKVKGDISKVTIISTGSVTHAQGSESKFRNIDFKEISNDEIEIVIDENENDLQDGNYLLFVLNTNGTPSEGKILYVN
ncbi:galactose oxidase-like domain-containing protein [Candidatus Pelagibacter sp.]|uniref:galactose oxidase-like domain-containing protein n=1 Tax=Candidatus Pelagibacter sp. TaxID=2024849 RepID=UPI003F836900